MSNPAKVCHITTVHYVFDTRIFYKECHTLSKKGYEVTLIAQNEKNETVEGIKIVALPKPKNRFQRMLLLPFKALQLALKERADIYHFHDPELILVGLLIKLISKRKVIYDVHEDVPKDIKSKFYLPRTVRGPVALFVGIIEKFSSYFFDAIIAATDSIQKKFAHHRRTIAIKNYPIIKYLSDHEKKQKESREFKLIHHGDLDKRRGIFNIVKALEYTKTGKDVRLYLAGRFSQPSLKEEISKLEGFKKVLYLGWVPYKELFTLMSSCDAGIHCLLPEPNHINSLPNKLFEFMMAGIPVIASNFPLWREIIEGKGCGICVDPTNPEEIAKAIDYLADHPDISIKMGENGKKAVMEEFNWENEEKKLLTLYQNLLQQ